MPDNRDGSKPDGKAGTHARIVGDAAPTPDVSDVSDARRAIGREASILGRAHVMLRLSAMVSKAAEGERLTALVAGSAGMGKTTLLGAMTDVAVAHGLRVGWGTAVAGTGAPGYWPWTQACNDVVRQVGSDRACALAGDDAPMLAAIATAIASTIGAQTSSALAVVSAGSPVLLHDAVERWLDALARQRPLLIVLDDLQWADDSSLALLEFVARSPKRAGVCVIGAYRHDELDHAAEARLHSLRSCADHVQLQGLDEQAVRALVERVAGQPVSVEASSRINRRSGGHPFFVRELTLEASLLAGRSASHAPDTFLDPEPDIDVVTVPVVVREMIERRLGRLEPSTLAMLEVAAVAGMEVFPDVIAGALAMSTADVEACIAHGLASGVLVAGVARARFAHDLLRETLVMRVPPSRRIGIHHTVAVALEGRYARVGDVAPGDVARHYSAAIPLAGPDSAARWARRAAKVDRSALAFVEAAGHLRRLRAAAADAGAAIADDVLTDVLLDEADALTRAGSPVDAKGLLLMARGVCLRSGDAGRLASVALADAELGSQFAMRRDDVIASLEEARAAVAGVDAVMEAMVTATLARTLQHSVADQRPRAEPLSRKAIQIGRATGDDAALLACLVARHDVLWTPGTADERATIAREIAELAQRTGTPERHAEGLLLLANAELERGSAAFVGALTLCLQVLDELAPPRHRYTAETRRAALALLHGHLDEAEERIDTATALGLRIREPDTGNVRMSQRLELVRARRNVDELHGFAVEAVEHWTGAPVHANAVAAGFYARAGDLTRARHHVDVVAGLGTWQADRSYLWSVFVRELAVAAIALDDERLCRELFDDVVTLAHACGVNGAFVAFAGSHAHTAGLLAAALGHPNDAIILLDRARTIYRSLGAPTWLAELDHSPASGAPAGTRPSVFSTAPAPTALPMSVSASPAVPVPRLTQAGRVWHLEFAGRTATLPHAKGLADLAVLLARPGVDVTALELMGSAGRGQPSGPVADRAALQAYRVRLADLDDDAAQAVRDHDEASAVRIEREREQLLAELRRATGLGGAPRHFANHPAERARKAISSRIRATIDTIRTVLPELADHLDHRTVTGTTCRYRNDLVSIPTAPPSAGRSQEGQLTIEH